MGTTREMAHDPETLEEQLDACDSLPREIQSAMAALKPNQISLLEEAHKLQDKIQQVSKEHFDSCRPLTKQRATVLKQRGESPAAAPADNESDEDDEPLAPAVGVPGFWLRALNSQPDVAVSITARDSSCLEALQDITIERKKGTATIEFVFGPNRFFSNKVLSKTLPSLEGSNIKWSSPESNLTRKEVSEKKSKAKKGKKGKEEPREAKSTKSTSSFFHLFSTVEGTSQHAQSQGQIIMAIVQEVVPNCVPLFMEPYSTVDEMISETDDPLAEVWRQPEVHARIMKLSELQTKLNESVQSVQLELQRLEREHHSHIAPLCAERSKLLSSNAPPRFWQQAFLSAGVSMSAADERLMGFVADIVLKQEGGNQTVELVFQPECPVGCASVSRSCSLSGEVTKSGGLDGFAPLYTKGGKKKVKSIFWAFESGGEGCLEEDEEADFIRLLEQQIVPAALCLYTENPDALEFIGESDDDEDDDDDDEDSEDDDDDDDDDDTASKAARGRKKAKNQKAEAGAAGGLNMMHIFTFLILSSILIQFLH